MGRYFYIKDNDIIANVSYFNVSKTYSIGFQIGKIYTILRDEFKSEDEAIFYLLDNFDYVKEME